MNKELTIDEAASIQAIIETTKNESLKGVMATIMGAYHTNALDELAIICGAFSEHQLKRMEGE